MNWSKYSVLVMTGLELFLLDGWMVFDEEVVG